MVVVVGALHAKGTGTCEQRVWRAAGRWVRVRVRVRARVRGRVRVSWEACTPILGLFRPP